MGWPEVLYWLYYKDPGNPRPSPSSGAGELVRSAVAAVVAYSGVQPRVEYTMIPAEPLWKMAQASGPYIRLAGITGAVAVIIGAYGAHKKYQNEELKQVFETANKYHFYHSLAMIGLALCKAPSLTATLWISGTIMFCGSCYYYAFTGDKKFSKITPIGGTCFILGWLTMCL